MYLVIKSILKIMHCHAYKVEICLNKNPVRLALMTISDSTG